MRVCARTVVIGTFACLFAAEPATAQDALVESEALAYATSTDTIQAASAIPGLPRGSIDVDVLMAVIRDRAQRAALNALITLFEEAADHELRVYERELLEGAAALLSPDAVSSRRLESLLMKAARVGLASLIVQAQFGNEDTARARWDALGAAPPERHEQGVVRRYLVDWAYWWLGESPLFRRDARSPPPCPESWGDAPVCATLAEEPTTNAEKLLGTRVLLGGLRAVERIYKMASDEALQGSLFPSDLIDALREAELVADFGSTPGLRFDEWRNVLLTDEMSHRLRLVYDATRALEQLAGDDVSLDQAKAAVVPIRAALDQHAVDLDGLEAPLRTLLTEIENATVDTAITVPTELGGRRLSKLIGPEAPLRRDVRSYVAAADRSVQDILTHVRRIEEIIRRVDQCEGLRIECVPLTDLPRIVTAVDAIHQNLHELSRAVRALGYLEDGASELLDLAVDRMRRLQAFLKLAAEFAKGAVGTTLSDVLTTIRVLDEELLAALEPILGLVPFDRPMGRTEIALMVLHFPSGEVAAALGLDTTSCEDGAPSPQCLLLAIHDTFRESLILEGETIRIDSDVVVQRFVSISDDLTTDRSGGWFFHLAIGLGGLWTSPIEYQTTTLPDGTTDVVIAERDSRWTPLVAEQIGVGLRTPRFGEIFVLKLGVFASGILYRILVDSAESEAFVAGAFIALDISEDIELYVVPASALIYPSEGDAGARAAYGFSAGIQVPLSAYLEAL